MEEWVLSIAFHFPHDRLAIGWEFINADEKDNYYTINVFLFIATLTLDMYPRT
jgi:hypothetical protein